MTDRDSTGVRTDFRVNLRHTPAGGFGGAPTGCPDPAHRAGWHRAEGGPQARCQPGAGGPPGSAVVRARGAAGARSARPDDSSRRAAGGGRPGQIGVVVVMSIGSAPVLRCCGMTTVPCWSATVRAGDGIRMPSSR